MNRRRFLASIPALLALPFIDRGFSEAQPIAYGTITGMTDANDVNVILDFEPIEFTEADVADWTNGSLDFRPTGSWNVTLVYDCAQNAWINRP